MEMVRTILPQISLLVLVVVIAVGFVKKSISDFFPLERHFCWHFWEWLWNCRLNPGTACAC